MLWIALFDLTKWILSALSVIGGARRLLLWILCRLQSIQLDFVRGGHQPKGLARSKSVITPAVAVDYILSNWITSVGPHRTIRRAQYPATTASGDLVGSDAASRLYSPVAKIFRGDFVLKNEYVWSEVRKYEQITQSVSKDLKGCFVLDSVWFIAREADRYGG